jgi:hypothetical protein
VEEEVSRCVEEEVSRCVEEEVSRCVEEVSVYGGGGGIGNA